MVKKKQQKVQQKIQKEIKPALPKYNIYIVIFILLIAGVLTYSTTFHGPFAFDDYRNITENEDIKSNSIYSQFNRPRYISFVTFAINYGYSATETFGYHLVNISIHLINALLVYLIFQHILLLLQNSIGALYRREIPLFIALLFLVHPIQTQAVTYIVQRMTSLAAFFALLSIYYYLKFRISKTKDYISLILSLMACFLAYKTKENTATLPLMIIAIELILFRHQKFSKERILYVIPFFILAVVIPLSFINMNQSMGNLFGEFTKVSYETQQTTRTEYLLTQFRVITTYIRMLFLPINQAIDYYYPLSQSLLEVKTLVAFCFLLALATLAVLIAKKYPVISLGIAWFFIFLAVESSIIPIKDVIFEHRLYLPSIGFIAAVIYSLYLLEEKLHWHKLAFMITIICIITLAIAAFYRNQLWKNEMMLWEDAANKYPLNARAVGNYGVALANKGLYKEAIQVLEKAIEVKPTDSSHWYSMAFCYKMMGEPDKAIAPYKKALELAPQYQKASVDLSMIYISKHDFTKAWDIMTKAKAYYPEHPYNNALIAQVYCETGDLKRAMPLFEQSKKAGLDYADMYFNFAICLINNQKNKEARQNFFKVIEFNANEVESNYFIAVTYDREKDYKKAMHFYNTFLSRTTKSQWLEEVRQRVQQLHNRGITPEIISIPTRPNQAPALVP